MSEVINTLRDVRMKRGLSKNETAKLIGVSPSTLTSWEENSTSKENLQRYAHAVGVRLEFGGDLK